MSAAPLMRRTAERRRPDQTRPAGTPTLSSWPEIGPDGSPIEVGMALVEFYESFGRARLGGDEFGVLLRGDGPDAPPSPSASAPAFTNAARRYG